MEATDKNGNSARREQTENAREEETATAELERILESAARLGVDRRRGGATIARILLRLRDGLSRQEEGQQWSPREDA